MKKENMISGIISIIVVVIITFFEFNIYKPEARKNIIFQNEEKVGSQENIETGNQGSIDETKTVEENNKVIEDNKKSNQSESKILIKEEQSDNKDTVENKNDVITNNNEIINNIETPKEKTKEEINNELRIAIQNKYGVNIKYGEEMGDYDIHEIIPVKLTDPDEINEYLNDMERYIAYYPTGFFKEIKDFEMPLTIYLVKYVPGTSIAGITDKQFYSNIIITLCVDKSFFRVFHHEIYHYIEAYMEIVSYKDGGIFNNWNNFNPPGFIYGTIDNNYSYSLVDTSKSPYFINDYGQTSAKEDRATIFEDLIARSYETSNSFVSTNKIWDKGVMIAETIDKYFTTVNSNTTERWERYIYN